MSKRKRSWVAGLLFLVVPPLHFFVGAEEALPTGQWQTVSLGTISSNVLCDGRVVVESPQDVCSPFTGRLKSLLVKEGQFLNKGELVGELESATLVSSITEARNRLSLLRSEEIKARRRLAEEPIRQRVALRDARLAFIAAKKHAAQSAIELASATHAYEQAKVIEELRQATVDRQRELKKRNYLAESSFLEGLKQLELAELSLAHTKTKYLSLKKQSSADQREAAITIERAQQKVLLAQAQLSGLQEDLKRDLELAALKVKQKEEELNRLESLWSSRKVLSPVDGVVGEVIKRAGTGLIEGERFICVYPKNGLCIESNVDEIDIVSLSLGQSATLSSQSFSGTTFAAKVSFIGPRAVVTDGLGRIKIRCSLEKRDERLLPGMAMEVDINTAKTENVLRVPINALFTEGQLSGKVDYRAKEISRFALKLSPVIGAKNIWRAEKTKVTIGECDENHCEIRDGLNVGDKLLVELPKDYKVGNELELAKEEDK